MGKATDVRVAAVDVYFLPVQARVPLKFGHQTMTHVTVARAKMTVADSRGRRAVGWGETPLAVQWSWPSALSYDEKHEAMKALSLALVKAWGQFNETGHPMELGLAFNQGPGKDTWKKFNAARAAEGREPMPWLAALVINAPFDAALHDAYANLHQVDVYDTYDARWMNKDLAQLMEREPFYDDRTDQVRTFEGLYPADFLILGDKAPKKLPAWHLVGGLDPIEPGELRGDEPNDGYPVLLRDWIARDGLKCLKVKLRGNDGPWDYDRLVKVGNISLQMGVEWLTADFNCTVKRPAYVTEILDRLKDEHPLIYGQLLYVEQPFPYELEENKIDVHSVSARKPLFMDESAHDWEIVKLGRGLGWTGVALKTCKTQTGAILSLCWAKAHGMTLMVQDLTNPMLAQIPHVRLAAHAGTIMGVETNGMQFYPDASLIEEKVHPGLYRRRNGVLDLSTLRGSGFGYRVDEIGRKLPDPAASAGA